MRLEAQIAALADAGLGLAPGREVADLLVSFPRHEYERRPFDLLLFVFGCEVEAEPWGRRFCERAWNFDTECVEGPGAYVRIVDQLCRVAGRPGALREVCDHVDLDAGVAWLRYTVDGRRRHLDATVDADWADPTVVGHVMRDLERDGHRFHARDNGQAAVLFYLDDQAAARVNALAGREVLAPT